VSAGGDDRPPSFLGDAGPFRRLLGGSFEANVLDAGTPCPAQWIGHFTLRSPLPAKSTGMKDLHLLNHAAG